MNFGGFIPMRRGILEHTQTGNLSTQEFAALSVLILLADKETGCGKTNAPVLMSWLPDLSYDAAKRVLLSLETKGYVFREIVPQSKRVYRYWINKFSPTVGPNKLLQIDLSKALVSKQAEDVMHVRPAPQTAPQGAPQTAPQGAPQGAPNNNKGYGIKESDKENPSPDSDNCSSTASQLPDDCAITAEVTRQCIPASAETTASQLPDDAVMTAQADQRLLGMGFQFVEGNYYNESGARLHPDAIGVLLNG